MLPVVAKQLEQVLSHLYINPLEKCNLKCKICYTRKTSPILSQQEIIEFIDRYNQSQPLKTVTFCGGEVFALTYFPNLINELTNRGLLLQVITNGTLDQLDLIQHPNSVNLIVSLDGVPEYHDGNRGEGNFAKSIAFMKKAHRLGFHVEVFSIVTHQNMAQIDSFEDYLLQELGFSPEVTYHPRKPPTYLYHHPLSNITGQIEGFDFLTKEEMSELMKTRNVFPPLTLGCYQIALVSDGKIYGCCEGTTALGMMSDEPRVLIDRLKRRLEQWSEEHPAWMQCLGCSQPDFVCGIKEYVQEIYAQAS